MYWWIIYWRNIYDIKCGIIFRWGGSNEPSSTGEIECLHNLLYEHQHNSISLLGLYHFDNGFTTAYAPGILFSEHDGNNEIHFTQHFEFYYEFELDQFHIGPQFDVGIEEGDLHYMFGIHFGIDIN